ncbi:MAG: hypothetical protein FJ123_11740 [Deltaproteobacteria bacterium]|nr:hypothetical protein [Deltaproteobacteria bacterium]
MEHVEIKSGPVEVVGSGTVIAFSGNPIEITIGSADDSIKVIFAFLDEEGKTDVRVEAKLLDNKTLKITLFNHRTPLGVGSSEPIPIGTAAGLRLYMNYRVFGFPGGDKTIHYTFYRGGID